MECYWASSKNPGYSQFKKGDLTEDFFETEFIGPYDKKTLDYLIEKFENKD